MEHRLTIVATLGLVLAVGILAALPVFASGVINCHFGGDFICYDYSFNHVNNAFSASFVNEKDKEVILSDFYLASKTGLVECWQTEPELHLTPGQETRLRMRCTNFERDDVHNKGFTLRASYRDALSDTTHNATAELYYPVRNRSFVFGPGLLEIIFMVVLLISQALLADMLLYKALLEPLGIGYRQNALSLVGFGILGSLLIPAIFVVGFGLSFQYESPLRFVGFGLLALVAAQAFFPGILRKNSLGFLVRIVIYTTSFGTISLGVLILGYSAFIFSTVYGSGVSIAGLSSLLVLEYFLMRRATLGGRFSMRK